MPFPVAATLPYPAAVFDEYETVKSPDPSDFPFKTTETAGLSGEPVKVAAAAVTRAPEIDRGAMANVAVATPV